MSLRLEPPRLARRLLERALPEDAREHVLGDLSELFERQVAERGTRAARRWYWGQALSFSARFARERVLDRKARSGISLLDFKLGMRMLVKYPVLSFVGGLALTVAIAIGAAWFEFANDYVAPELTIAGGERIVGIRTQDLEAGQPTRRVAHDFLEWREQVRSIEEIGAFRDLERNLVTPDRRAQPVRGVEMSAAGFRIASTPPVLGRPLVEADEAPGAPPVVVLGHELWQERFAGDPSVLGRVVQLGETRATVVGVMPQGFAFPINHELWAPLRLDPLAYPRGGGPAIRVFGRLAAGTSVSAAQAEMSTIGQRAAADHPEVNGQLRVEVRPYVESLVGGGRLAYLGNLVMGLVLLVICTNVGSLIFARTATRAGEIVVRSALGASRTRIVLQLFAEALVLALVSATVGLLIARGVMRYGMNLFWTAQGGVELRPFWWNDAIEPSTVLYVLLLATIAAVLAGVVPAIKVTGRGMASRLRQAAAGRAGLRFGGVWTAIIIGQVAITVMVLPVSVGEVLEVVAVQGRPLNYAYDELLSARLVVDDDEATETDGPDAGAERRAALQEELRRRIEAEPGIVGVSFASAQPSAVGQRFVIRADAPAGESVHTLGSMSVDETYFAAVGATVALGRGFEATDRTGGRHAIVVNESFVRTVFGGESPIGQRVRSVPTTVGSLRAGFESGPSMSMTTPEVVEYEVVGVVRDLGGGIDAGMSPEKLYRLAAPGTLSTAWLGVRTTGGPEDFAPRLRQLTADLSPALRLYEVNSLAQIGETEKRAYYAAMSVLAAFGAIALLLSTVGVHSLMSFAVSQRTREIGVRAALGAEPRRIVVAIFSRAVMQLSIGVAIGAGLVLLTSDEAPLREALIALGMVAGLMTSIGLAACVVPVRRALRIQPTEALRAEG